MFDYNIEQVLEILKNLNDNINEENTLRTTKHVQETNMKRNKDLNLIYESLLNRKPVGILKQD